MEVFDIGIIVPLDEEFDALKAICPVRYSTGLSGEFYYVLDLGIPETTAVAVVLREMGPAVAARRTEALINSVHVRSLALLGIAGSLDNNVHIGDVVVAEEINHFQAASKAVDRGKTFAFQYSGAHWRTLYTLSTAAANFRHAHQPAYQDWQRDCGVFRQSLSEAAKRASRELPMLHVGHIASGDTVVAAGAYKLELTGIDRHFLAVEMEAAGVARAANDRAEPIALLVVRGISDAADRTKGVLDHQAKGDSRRLAMANAVKSFLALIQWAPFRTPLLRQPVPASLTGVAADFDPFSTTSARDLPFPIEDLAGAGSSQALNPVGIDMAGLRFVEVMSDRSESVVCRVSHEGTFYVLKRTTRRVCDEEAIRKLVGKDIVARTGGRRVTIATPLCVWSTTTHLYELHYFYEGDSLFQLIERNKYHLNGDYLGALFNGVVSTLIDIHGFGILHRDIRPQNIILRLSGDVVLIDATFCCLMSGPQLPVSNPSFTAPEQSAGEAVPSSDLYSLAATVFYLVNGFAPHSRGERDFEQGLSRITIGGQYDAPPGLEFEYDSQASGVVAVFEVLLREDVTRRPQEAREAKLAEHSAVAWWPQLLGVLKLQNDSLLLVYDQRCIILGQQQAKVELRNVLERDSKQYSDELVRDIEAYLNGQYTWAR